jgi:hypothetical protein
MNKEAAVYQLHTFTEEGAAELEAVRMHRDNRAQIFQ